jgi:hypothetical protein
MQQLNNFSAVLILLLLSAWCGTNVSHAWQMSIPPSSKSRLLLTPKQQQSPSPPTVTHPVIDSDRLSSSSSSSSIMVPSTSVLAAVASAIVTAYIPFLPIVQAIVDDDYEYGAVDAPIGIAVGGGLLAILTALLPIALRGGEEAFEEIKDRDSTTFGKGNNDILKGKKK